MSLCFLVRGCLGCRLLDCFGYAAFCCGISVGILLSFGFEFQVAFQGINKTPLKKTFISSLLVIA